MNTIQYTSPELAAEIIQTRRNDPSISRKVLEYLGGDLPSSVLQQSEKPVSILANYVAAGTNEDRDYRNIAQSSGFEPYWATYQSAPYMTTNPKLVAVVRPPILWRKGQRTRSWSVATDKRQGGVGTMQTNWGITTSDYQNNLRGIAFENDLASLAVDNQFDVADWYRRQAGRFGYREGQRLAPYYVIARMALVTTFCAYMRDYEPIDPRFMDEVVEPALEKVRGDLGLEPVIVELPKISEPLLTDLSFLDEKDESKLKMDGRL